jgi:uncharacterized phage-associated protein
MNDGRAIANFVLDVCESEKRSITNLSLQKIVFFCHAWSLANLGKPLIKHQFEAWQYGPVLQYLYRDFRDFEREPITSRAKKLNPVTGASEVVPYQFDTETEVLLRKVVGFYARLSAGTLVELSHVEEGPWHRAWNHSGKVNPGMKIDDASIRGYFLNSRVPF